MLPPSLLEGLAGNDRLDGKAGADAMKGGNGGDTFAFTTALGSANVDTVADFVSGADRIELSQAIFSALRSGALSTTAFVQAAAATNTDQHIIYNSTTGCGVLRCRRQGRQRGGRLRQADAGPIPGGEQLRGQLIGDGTRRLSQALLHEVVERLPEPGADVVGLHHDLVPGTRRW